jgi:hypothetical protein
MPYPEELVNSALENVAEAADSLPKAELNPLINPVLGRNLGRWAQVYFTSPPERREEAVGELLRELQREGPGEPIAPVPPAARKVQSKPTGDVTQQLLCPVCQRLNHIGQRFCGYCRLPLTPDAERDSRDDPDKSNKPNTSPNTVSGDDELEWLRDKALSSFDEPQAPARRGFVYLVVGVLILATAFGYLQWASSQAGSPAQPSAASAPSAALQPPAQVSDVSQPKALKERQSAAVSSKAPDTGARGNKLSEAGLRSEPSQQATLPEPTKDETDAAGTDELAAAQRYLEGKNGARDSSQAAKWLWKAVGKQNPGAALLLAELYARGDGVPKSCDQARLLLVAAAKRGAPDAGLRLRNLESSDCQ